MSNPIYPAGAVATATVRGKENVRVMRVEDYWISSTPTEGYEVHREGEVTDIRPLVVLDLADMRGRMPAAPTADELPSWLRKLADSNSNGSDTLGSQAARLLADQIEAQTRPAIEEPKGLGAVVEDYRGHKYVRVADPIDGWMAGRDWQRIGGEVNAVRNFGWSDLTPARVLSEGVA